MYHETKRARGKMSEGKITPWESLTEGILNTEEIEIESKILDLQNQ